MPYPFCAIIERPDCPAFKRVDLGTEGEREIETRLVHERRDSSGSKSPKIVHARRETRGGEMGDVNCVKRVYVADHEIHLEARRIIEVCVGWLIQ